MFHLPEEMRHCVASALHHPMLYIDKFKDIEESSKDLA